MVAPTQYAKWDVFFEFDNWGFEFCEEDCEGIGPSVFLKKARIARSIYLFLPTLSELYALF